MIDKKNIFIFGDIILDHYIKGEINRMTNEFSIPVPILDSITEDYRLGGAANVAHNMANLGASITLIGYININDESGIILLNLLGKMGIKFININEYNLYPTIRKTRILSGIKQICRIDKEEYIKYDNSDLIKLIQDDVINLGTADAVIFSDYAKGVITQFMVDTVLNISNNNIHPILISYDPKPNNKINYRGVDLLKPNLKEAYQLLNLDETDFGRNYELIVDLLYKKYLNKYIVLTLSENGICTLEDGNIFFHHENVQTDLFDISGAGDTIISVITFALSNGYNLNEAVIFSLKAVKNVISKFGTTAIDNMDILNQMKV